VERLSNQQVVRALDGQCLKETENKQLPASGMAFKDGSANAGEFCFGSGSRHWCIQGWRLPHTLICNMHWQLYHGSDDATCTVGSHLTNMMSL